jgi:RNA polymerase sigma-70 factor (ECF subfamily)
VSHATDGDRVCLFEDLFARTRADLLGYLLRRAGNAEDAADLLAETYLIAWRKLDYVPPGAQARLWLFGVARNLLMRGASRRRSADALLERLASKLRTAQRPAEAADGADGKLVRDVLAGLNERDREILTLTAWEGLTPAEIAVATGTSANLVRVRLHRARARIKRQLTGPRKGLASGQAFTVEPD